jgi:hypothetical protein
MAGNEGGGKVNLRIQNSLRELGLKKKKDEG